MARDDTKLAYASPWDIDKVVDYQDSSDNPDLSVVVPASSPTVIIAPHTYGYRPYVIAQYKPSTQNRWFEPGENLQFSSSQLVTMDMWISDNTVIFSLTNGHASSVTVEIRYWVLSDGN